MPRKVDPALAIEAAFRQEILGQKGVYFGGRIMSSRALRKLATPSIFPLPPFDIVTYYSTKTDFLTTN